METDPRHLSGCCPRRAAALAIGPQAQQFFTLPGTLTANLVGGYIIGFCGGLTTFSTFSAEVVTLLQENRLTWAMRAIATHVTGSLVMTVAGLATWQLLKHS